MKIGVISNFRREDEDLLGLFRRVSGFGLSVTQLCSWQSSLMTEEVAARVRQAHSATGVSVCGFWCGYSGRVCWNFTEGPVTLGLVPYETRARRMQELKRGADFAKSIGAPAVITHAGFLPENMTDANYRPVRDALAEVAGYCASLGLGFWFETGQETPVVLLRYIEDIGMDNLGINLDPANLLMYGKGNPVDALDVFGKYVRNLHVKDGCTPTDGHRLGHEKQVGQGMVHFERLLPRLRELGFDGELVIEREIPEGEEQRRDIQETIENIHRWWNQ